MTQTFEGEIVRNSQSFGHRDDMRALKTPAVALWPRSFYTEDTLISFIAKDVILTSGFISIENTRNIMLLDQTYTDFEKNFPIRFSIRNNTYRLDCDPIALAGRYVVIGGPIDGVWYHWLFNWCPRLLVLKWLRPDVFEDPEVHFIVHPRAMQEPFRSVLATFGIPEDRILALALETDYRIEQAYIVSFCDQNKLYPDLIRAFADHLLCSFNIDKADTDRRRVFASRQTLPAPKRRVENFDIIEPVLRAHRFEIEALGRLSAEAQARLFCQADVVVGGHGSDLANLLFCRPGTLVLVFENNFSVSHHLHIGLKLLCEVLSLDYEVMVCPTSAAGPKVSTLDHINQDYVVDPIALKARLDLIEDG